MISMFFCLNLVSKHSKNSVILNTFKIAHVVIFTFFSFFNYKDKPRIGTCPLKRILTVTFEEIIGSFPSRKIYV